MSTLGDVLPTVLLFSAVLCTAACRADSVFTPATERYRGADWDPASSSHTCGDNYGTPSHPVPGGHNLGYSRSSDGGHSWSSIVHLAGNLSNLDAVGGVDYTNNAVLRMTLPGGQQRLLWQGSTQNNPSRLHHGYTFQRISDDFGHSWTSPMDLGYASAAQGLAGATPGPGNGVQLPDGKIVFCAWSNNSTKAFSEPGWGDAANFGNLLTYSEDFGETWKATAPIFGQGWNECFIAALNNSHDSSYDGIEYALLEISRRKKPDSSVKPYEPNTYASVRFSADLSTRSEISTLTKSIETPVCEGCLLKHEGALYFSHPQSTQSRVNLTVHKSMDGGVTWPQSVVVWDSELGGSGYSACVATGDGLGLAFNEWPMDDPKSSKDGPGQFIRFVHVPWSAFE